MCAGKRQRSKNTRVPTGQLRINWEVARGLRVRVGAMLRAGIYIGSAVEVPSVRVRKEGLAYWKTHL